MDQAQAPQQTRPYHALTVTPNVEQLILAELATGKSLKRIADDLGVSDVAVLQRVVNLPAYKAVQAVGLELRMDRREAELESAQDNVSVTRSDRLLGHARWLAERCAPDRFGQRTHMTIETGPGDLDERIRRAMAAERAVIDGP